MPEDVMKRAERADSINQLNTALQRYAKVLLDQGFTFNQLTEDVDDLLGNVRWPGDTS